jgi:membrane protein
MNALKRWQRQKLLRWLQPLYNYAKQVTLPGFDRVPLYDVGSFFFKGIKNGAITTRASSVAFNLIMAVFPAIIFIFTMIPLIPVKGFQTELLLIIESIVPDSVYGSVQKTIEDIIIIPHGGLLSLGFVLAMFFSTNGIVSLISAFNASVNVTETRSWIAIQLIAIVLVLILSLLMTTGISLIVFTQSVLNQLVKQGFMSFNFTYHLVSIGKWLIIFTIFYFAYSFLYYLGPARKSKWRFISAGSTVATVLSIFITLGFGYYIDNFTRYNALYGSIGALPVIMLMFYFNCLSVIIGFELNVGILAARKNSTPLQKSVVSVDSILQNNRV